MGNDIVQGDGGIETAFAGSSHAGASRSPGGCQAGTVACDYVGDLDVVGSFEAASDGEDYIEGNAGDDIAFGGLGQDDILGGSSDFFSLVTPDMRPDGDDMVFGGAGTKIGRNTFDAPSDGTAATNRHSRDADTIVTDNGRIIRIVGINGVDGAGVVAPNKYLTFNYDWYGALRLIVRGVTLLDYSPGGPDMATTMGLNLFPAFNGTSCHGNDKYHDIGGYDEVHGETGDDTIYTGCGNDVAFGDAEDDDMIMGWGHDWATGGTGEDGILGDDGRIFTSRNASAYGEPLFGILALLASDPDDKFSNGNVLDEFIYTPGMHQQTTINIHDQLKKTVDLTPFWVDPLTPEDLDPHADTLWMDDILFGGLGFANAPGHDWLHAGAGDDALGGNEALSGPAWLQIATNMQDSAGLAGLGQSDWNHPFNPGNTLRFSIEHDKFPGGAHGPVLRDKRAGQFALYDDGTHPHDRVLPPRQKIGLSLIDGLPVIGSGGAEWFLNFDPIDPGAFVLPGGTAGQGGQTFSYGPVQSDGDDLMFGDAGNDWLVGGTGQDTAYGGSGNDLLNMDDDHRTNGGANDTTDTHPSYEDRAFGGAGKDVLYANTGGDRLIDWVGEFNSYLVPFAPFGMSTVSRTNQPQLPEFLYALSASHGADPTRATDIPGGDPARNGEPDGELGLVRQHDRPEWHDQIGPPSDPQAGNIPGGRRDVLRTASATSVHGGGKAKAGSTVSLTFTLTNSSPHALSSVMLAPTFPTGGKIVGKFKGGSSTTAGLTCDLYGCVLASLAKGASVVVTLDYEILSATEAGFVELGAFVGLAGSESFDVVADEVEVALATPTAPMLAGGSGEAPATNNTNPTLSGRYVPNVRIELFQGTTLVGSGLTDAAGDWAIALAVALADGTYSFAVRSVDANGVASELSASQTVVIDTQAPTITVPAAISVVADPGKTSAKVTFAVGRNDNNPGATGTCSSVSGSWFAIGMTEVSCTAIDAAGNTATASFTITVEDWKIVAQPGRPQLAPGSDTGPSQFDGVTGVNRPTLVVAGPAGSLVQILIGGVVVGEAIAGDSNTAVITLGAALADGSYSLTARVLDLATGETTTSAALVVTVDTHGPTGSFMINGNSAVIGGMNVATDPFLALALSFADAHGLALLEISTDGGATWTEAQEYLDAEAAILTGADGVYTVAVRVTDTAGNSTVVTKQVRLDRSGPAVTVGGVGNGSVYDLGQKITVTFAATDASGVANVAATLDSKAIVNGTVISTNTLTAGTHKIVVTATDALGNKTQVEVTFTLRVSTAGLQGAVDDGANRNLLDRPMQVQLNGKLQSAQAAINRGDKASAKSMLQSFISQVQSNSGKKIDAAYAAQLVGWANDILSRL